MSISDVLFKPNGRIQAGQFWIGWGILVVANIVSNFIPILNFLLYFGLIYVGVCVYGKRLHDMGKSAWLVAIPWGIGLVLGVIGIALSMPALMILADGDPRAMEDTAAVYEAMGPFMACVGAGMLVWLGLTIWVGTAASDPNDNKYGPSPTNPGGGSADIFA
jgi:uncharacterized membrane protein YhaH (DUF805 family)